MANLNIDLAGLQLKNPVLTASGTFGYGTEFSDFIDLERLGGFIVKGTTLHPRQGNAYPRLAETPSGMINAVGLQNKGVQYYIEHIHPGLEHLKTNVIVNLSGSCIEDYVEGARMLNEVATIPAVELNISCPNVKAGGMGFGTRPEMAAEVVSAVREVYKKPLIVKPIALRCVWQVYNAVQIPIVGLGGIMNATDAIEFMLCGARAIEVGTANFIDPAVTVKIVEGINDYLDRHGCQNVSEIVGALKI